MTHLDLFSGIGGFALAVDEVWPGSEHIFCEIDPFCQALLKKRFEGSKVYGDIRQLTADTESRQSRLKETGNGWKDTCRGGEERIDLLTGGFPCQPFSQAGKRRGTEDNRFLWPEMLRVIREFQPTWVIAENVRGLLTIEQGMVFEQVCLDLENEGYEVQPFIIPAVAKNAPHRRDRVWIVAHRNERTSRPRDESESGTTAHEELGSKDTDNSNAPDSTEQGRQGDGLQGQGRLGQRSGDRERQKPQESTMERWEQNWLEVATRFCGVDDGLPCELDGLKLSKSRHRVERLKSLGNAIVPQVAIEIMRAISKI